MFVALLCDGCASGLFSDMSYQSVEEKINRISDYHERCKTAHAAEMLLAASLNSQGRVVIVAANDTSSTADGQLISFIILADGPDMKAQYLELEVSKTFEDKLLGQVNCTAGGRVSTMSHFRCSAKLIPRE